MKYPRSMPSSLGAGLARGMRGVSTLRADTGLAGGFVPTGPRVAKLDRAWRWAAATQWPARRVVGCGGVAFGCTSWPAFCLAAGASLPQCSLAGEGPPSVPGTYPLERGCAAGHAIPAPVGLLLPLTGKLAPAVRPCGCTPGVLWGWINKRRDYA